MQRTNRDPERAMSVLQNWFIGGGAILKRREPARRSHFVAVVLAIANFALLAG